MRQIFNNGPGAPSTKGLSIGPRYITFLKQARENFKITKDVVDKAQREIDARNA